MGVVAGADEVEQTPQAAARGPQTAARTAQASEQMPGASQGGASTAEQAQGVTPTADQAQRAGSPVEQSSATTNHAAQNSEQQTPEAEPPVEQAPPSPGFGERGRMRRRARFLRKARELAYRDLGGLVFDLHRFGQRNDPLVLAKLATLRELDTELRGLEDGLHEHRPVTVLREVGIAACPRCAAIHGSDDRFCPGCGLAFDANADRPISTAPGFSRYRLPLAQYPSASRRLAHGARNGIPACEGFRLHSFSFGGLMRIGLPFTRMSYAMLPTTGQIETSMPCAGSDR